MKSNKIYIKFFDWFEKYDQSRIKPKLNDKPMTNIPNLRLNL